MGNEGNKTSCESLKELDAIGIYFSAHWCPPCRGFTPKLAESYAKMKDAGKKWEIVFASSDQSEKDFEEYFGEMPWKALPHGDDRKDELDSMFEVSGIPTLVVIDAKTGNVITKSGRAMIDSDQRAQNFRGIRSHSMSWTVGASSTSTTRQWLWRSMTRTRSRLRWSRWPKHGLRPTKRRARRR